MSAGEAVAAPTALERGLLVCRTCRLVCRGAGLVTPQAKLRCPRCNTPLSWRIPGSISRTWALLFAAFLLYVPANVLPIMRTASLFGRQSDTILSGILYLWTSGSWPLAIIVFIASFMVPLAKLVVLSALLISVQLRLPWSPERRTVLYRVLETIGRWSMLDIFVMTILVAVVQLPSLAQIEAEPGAVAFGAVVVLTMLAAFSFDPRLIWDADTANHRAHGR